MKRYRLICIWAIASIAILSATAAFSQEKSQSQAAATPAEELSVYGEVQAVNEASDSITVQYYDYDSDEEKPMELILDKDTKLENAAALNDIKQNDWVDVTYSVSEGKNVAKLLRVEREEAEEAEGGLAPEKTPAEIPEEE